MKSFKTVQQGDKLNFLAEEWNDVREASRIVFERLSTKPNVPQRSGSAKSVVKVQNNQPEPVPEFGVLAITGPVHVNKSLFAQHSQAAESWIEVNGGPPTGEENELLCILQRYLDPMWIGPCVVTGPTPAWVYVNDTGHLYAKPIPENVQMLESAETGPARLMHNAPDTGLQLLPVLLGLPAGEPAVNAKELFPAAVYRRMIETQGKDGSTTEEPETYVICPGGRGVDRSIKTVHVLHVEKKKMSTSIFGTLPMAMSNFDAALADNGYGDPMLVCAPGEVDEGTRYPVQRYEFSQEQWSKSDTNQSLAGCPAYVLDGKVIVAGGQSAYHAAGPTQNAVGGTWGFAITPFWSIDPIAGTLESRIPLRKTSESFSATTESNIVNQQKRFLKQNFSGIFLQRTVDGKPVEFLGVGGTELLGYQANAIVSYAMNSTGPILDCEHPTINVGGNCEVFPDTPLPLGECRAVRIRRRRSGNMMVDCDLLVCIGGRYRGDDGKFIFHKKPWSLNLENKTEGWRNDLFPEIPTPRVNAALSDVVTSIDTIKETDPVTGEETEKKVEYDRVFLIGGRTEKGLTASIEAFNLSTGKWEIDWPGLDGRTPKPKNDEQGENNG